MKLSLRSLVRNLIGRGAAQTAARPLPKTQLHVERLEERAVPTAWIAAYDFPIYNAAHVQTGLLHVTNEDMNTGAFYGTFSDYTHGLSIAVTGHVKQVTPLWDSMNFQGSGGNFLTHESVKFNGWVSENPSYVMEGNLTQSYSQMTGWFQWSHWSTSTWEDPTSGIPSW